MVTLFFGHAHVRLRAPDAIRRRPLRGRRLGQRLAAEGAAVVILAPLRQAFLVEVVLAGRPHYRRAVRLPKVLEANTALHRLHVLRIQQLLRSNFYLGQFADSLFATSLALRAHASQEPVKPPRPHCPPEKCQESNRPDAVDQAERGFEIDQVLHGIEEAWVRLGTRPRHQDPVKAHRYQDEPHQLVGDVAGAIQDHRGPAAKAAQVAPAMQVLQEAVNVELRPHEEELAPDIVLDGHIAGLMSVPQDRDPCRHDQQKANAGEKTSGYHQHPEGHLGQAAETRPFNPGDQLCIHCLLSLLLPLLPSCGGRGQVLR
mmetsp:Transcript_100285/g.223870  ORF Transcript_100285/g.223870 Transcript_100285/m.223870 type:complete len:315 (+) Transcript_100285:3-947(+)